MKQTVSAMLAFMLVLTAWAEAEIHPGADEFVARAEQEYDLDPERVRALLAQAEFKQSIVDAISRPAEAKPWHEYRPIFLTPQRIAAGVEFWRENRELIGDVAEKTGVAPEIIVAIVGVETYYGRITGGFRVIDALATLAFYYPQDLARDRSEFFSGELLHLMVLGDEEGLPLAEVTGSYAGAMGLGQFMPSSYREYAVDHDGDGSRDLWRSTADVVGSVANYLARHGWESGGPVARRAFAGSNADLTAVQQRDFTPRLTVMELHERGFRSAPDLDPDRKAALLRLEEENRHTLWLVFRNFYVITRYNRSPLYAMAVYELSQEILEEMEQGG